MPNDLPKIEEQILIALDKHKALCIEAGLDPESELDDLIERFKNE